MHRPDLDAQALQREDGGRVADVAIGDVGLEGDHVHRLAGAAFRGRQLATGWPWFIVGNQLCERDKAAPAQPGTTTEGESCRCLPAPARAAPSSTCPAPKTGSASCRERVCQYGSNSGVAGPLQQTKL